MAVASSVSDLPLRSTFSFTRFPGLRLEMASRAWRASAIFLPSIATITSPGCRPARCAGPPRTTPTTPPPWAPAANRSAVLQNFLHHVFGQAGGDGKADALVTAAAGEHGGIDPDEIALGVDPPAAGTARVD